MNETGIRSVRSAQGGSRKDVTAWDATFPDDVKSEETSNSFIKRMIYITFAQILEMRQLLPLSAFKLRKFEGLRLQVFQTTDKLGLRNAQRLLGIADAIERGYLKELYLVVSINEEDDDDAVEVYKMAITYGDIPSLSLLDKFDRPIMKDIRYRGIESTKTETRKLLVRLLRISTALKPLPRNAQASYRMSFYDHTPRNYEIDGHRRYHKLYTFSGDNEPVTIGSTTGMYHRCALSVQSVFMGDAGEFEEAISNSTESVAHVDNSSSELNSSDGSNGGQISLSTPPQSESADARNTEMKEPARKRSTEDAVEVAKKKTRDDAMKTKETKKPHKTNESVEIDDDTSKKTSRATRTEKPDHRLNNTPMTPVAPKEARARSGKISKITPTGSPGKKTSTQ